MNDELDVFLLEMVVYDPAIPGTKTLRLATGLGHVTGPSETPANAWYEPRVTRPLNLSRTLFGLKATRGRSTVGAGDLVLANLDGALDALRTYGVDGRELVVRRGKRGAAYPAGFPEVLVGTMAGLEFSDTEVIIKLRNRLEELTVPLQPTKYAGTNALPAGLEGVEDLKGKPKPLCFGRVLNVPAVCVNTSKLIYQVNDGAIQSLPAVYDRGVALKAARGTFVLAGGTATTIAESSFLGLTWVSGSASMPANIRVIRHFANLWLLGADSGQLRLSDDGETWTDASTAAGFGSDAIHCVGYDGTQWIIGGANGQMAYSLDRGVTWNPIIATPWGTATLRGIAYGKGLWVVCYANNIAYSHDGRSWTQVALGTSTYRAVIFGGGWFVTVGESNIDIRWSTDGRNWNAATPAHGAGGYWDIAYSGVTFCVVGDNAGAPLIATALAPSLTWTSRTSATSTARRCITWTGTVFVSAGVNSGTPSPTIEHSPTGTSLWTAVNDPIPTTHNTIATGKGGSALDTFSTLSALEDDAQAPPPGAFKPYLSGGYFRLGAAPAGIITADVNEGAVLTNRYPAQVFTRVLTKAGKTSADWSAADVTALDAVADYEIGYWTAHEEDVASVLDRVAGSVGAAWFPDAQGVYRIQQLLAPTASSVLDLTENDLLEPLAMARPTDFDGGLPVFQTILRYARHYVVQDFDVAAAVTAARRARLAKEYLEVKSTDATVQTKHLLAAQTEEASLLVATADAQEEADRRETLRKVQRWIFPLVVPLNSETETLELNKVIKLTHPRFGFSAGEKLLVLGLVPDGASRRLTIHAWGPN